MKWIRVEMVLLNRVFTRDWSNYLVELDILAIMHWANTPPPGVARKPETTRWTTLLTLVMEQTNESFSNFWNCVVYLRFIQKHLLKCMVVSLRCEWLIRKKDKSKEDTSSIFWFYFGLIKSSSLIFQIRPPMLTCSDTQLCCRLLELIIFIIFFK